VQRAASSSGAGPVVQGFLEDVARRARESGVFGGVSVEGGRVACPALASAEPAEYRVDVEGSRVFVSLVTSNRWLSESIEAELMHTGDKIEELLEEELVDQGYEGHLTCQHYRSDDLLFTFRSELPLKPESAGAADAARCLLAYEACFRELGDMQTDEEEGP
jgi:hypothetical protein